MKAGGFRVFLGSFFFFFFFWGGGGGQLGQLGWCCFCFQTPVFFVFGPFDVSFFLLPVVSVILKFFFDLKTLKRSTGSLGQLGYVFCSCLGCMLCCCLFFGCWVFCFSFFE